ncbi:MAG TPA: hypothetical protein VKE22_10790 [Haliangiales bacterium]|nr:hypothetical protein [Haliangiales bacterium]
MRRAAAIGLVIGTLVGAAAPASAQALKTRFGATVGYRNELGDLGQRYAHGFSFGMEAGLQVGWLGFALSLSRSTVYSSRADNFDNSVFLMEASATVRPRIRLRGESNALFVQASVDLLRASFPIAPDSSQSYFGPSVGFGGEFGLGRVTAGAAVKYGLLFGGPASVQIIFTLAVGLQ